MSGQQFIRTCKQNYNGEKNKICQKTRKAPWRPWASMYHDSPCPHSDMALQDLFNRICPLTGYTCVCLIPMYNSPTVVFFLLHLSETAVSSSGNSQRLCKGFSSQDYSRKHSSVTTIGSPESWLPPSFPAHSMCLEPLLHTHQYFFE